jgi:glycerophosphoryl diester phosphodiesterase
MALISPRKPMVIAHRGVAHIATENTIAAFEAAIVAQADMVEFDVRSTQDHVLVVHHDPEIDRNPIAQLTWAEIRSKYPNIPSLQATIECCKGRVLIDVELKEIGQEIEAIEILLSYLSIDSFVITSFNLKSLQTIKQTYPNITIGLLLKRSWHDRTFDWIFDRHFQTFQSQIAELQPDFLAPHESLLQTQWLQRINPNDLPYWVWTVNQADRMSDLIQNNNVHAIITDNVDLGLEIREKNN